MRPNLCAFISGHGDLTEKEFVTHYVPLIDDALEGREGYEVKEFVVGDFKGADLMAQAYLNTKRDIKVTVYHMFDTPRHNPYNFPTIGGFGNDEERDAAMTLASTRDIVWIRTGKETSGTAKNALRRSNEPCQLRREPFFQCCCTCIHHKPVYFHCCTEPKPTDEQKAEARKIGSWDGDRCVCGIQKGWACVCPMSDAVYDNWLEHSCGCELHTTKEEDEKWRKQKDV